MSTDAMLSRFHVGPKILLPNLNETVRKLYFFIDTFQWHEKNTPPEHTSKSSGFEPFPCQGSDQYGKVVLPWTRKPSGRTAGQKIRCLYQKAFRQWHESILCNNTSTSWVYSEILWIVVSINLSTYRWAMQALRIFVVTDSKTDGGKAR